MGNSAQKFHIFSTFFYDTLSGKFGYNAVKNWATCDIFTKDILMIPINHSKCHWSLFVVVNPGKIEEKVSNMDQDKDVTHTYPFCLYFDSMGCSNTFHKEILHYLNKEATKLEKFASSEKNLLFDTETLPCFAPTGKCMKIPLCI